MAGEEVVSELVVALASDVAEEKEKASLVESSLSAEVTSLATEAEVGGALADLTQGSEDDREDLGIEEDSNDIWLTNPSMWTSECQRI